MGALQPSIDSRSDRQLRIFTIIAMVPGLALLIPSGTKTGEVMPAIGLVPMAMSAVLGAATLTGKRFSARQLASADIITAVLLFAVLIPSYFLVVETTKDPTLRAFAMTPMTIDLCVHVHLAILYLPSFFEAPACPHCEHCAPVIPRWQHASALHDTTSADHERPLAPHEHTVGVYGDRSVRASSDYQTSGFSWQRESAETLRDSDRGSGI